MAEAPEIWVRSVELRTAIGYKDNLLLGRTPTERSVLIGSGADLTLARLPLDGKQLSFLLSADDTRYLQGHAVDHEDLVVALAQVKVDLSSAWRLGTDLRYVYQDQVVDTSVTETNLTATALRGHGAALLPNVRWDFALNTWLELSGTAQRQFYKAPLDDYWEGGPKLTVGHDYGYRSSVSFGYWWNRRDYDTRRQVSLTNTSLPGTSLQFFQHEVELAWRHNWDSQRRWRTTTRLGFQVNRDNGPGFYDYARYLATQQFRYVAPAWEFKLQGRIYYYNFDHQSVSLTDSTDPHRRQKAVAGVSVRGERKLGKQLKLFAEYEYEKSLSNRAVDEYQANKIAGGVGWEF